MKTVFDNDMCAHMWAQLSQPHGRSSSMHFDGAVLYSYSTPIANILPVRNGERDRTSVVLVTSRGYSNTTRGKHIPAARAAVRGSYARVFHVPDVGERGDRAATLRDGPLSDPNAYASVHAFNLGYLVDEYREAVAREMRAVRPQVCPESLTRAHKDVADYCTAFGLTMPAIDMPADNARIRERVERLAAIRADPRYAAKREKAEATRAALAERRAELARADYATRAAAWLAGEAIQFPRSADFRNGDSAVLRIRRDKVETSWGAEVSVPDARALLAHVDMVRESGCPWTGSCHAPMAVGPFTVRRIDANGDLTVGCHFIKWEAIERIAATLRAGA